MLIFLPLKLSKSMKDRWQNVNRVYWPENLFCQIKLSKEADSLERIVYIMFFENWSNIYPQTRRERLVYMHRCRREQCAMQASAWSCVLQQQQQQPSVSCHQGSSKTIPHSDGSTDVGLTAIQLLWFEFMDSTSVYLCWLRTETAEGSYSPSST